MGRGRLVAATLRSDGVFCDTFIAFLTEPWRMERHVRTWQTVIGGRANPG